MSERIEWPVNEISAKEFVSGYDVRIAIRSRDDQVSFSIQSVLHENAGPHVEGTAKDIDEAKDIVQSIVDVWRQHWREP